MTIELREEGALIDSVKPGYYGCDCGYGCSGGGGCNCTGDTPTPTPDTGITSIRIIVADTITDTGKASVVFTPSTARTSFYFSSSDESIAVINPDTGKITVIQTGVVTFCVEDLLSGLEDCKVVNVIKSEDPDTGSTGCTEETRIKLVYDVKTTADYTIICRKSTTFYENGQLVIYNDWVTKVELEDGTDITSSLVVRHHTGADTDHLCYKFSETGITTLYLTTYLTHLSLSFYHIPDLVDAEIPCNIKVIGTDTFESCYALKNIVIYSDDTQIISSIITLPQNELSSFTFTGNVIRRPLTDDEILEAYGDRATNKSKRMYTFEQMLVEAYGIKTIYGPSATENNKMLIANDGTLVAVALKDMVECVIPSGVTRIGAVAFRGCTSLRRVTIPSTVTTIGWGAFSGCTSLDTIVIPGSVEYIAEDAFSNCTSLTNVTLQNGLKNIGLGCFRYCSSLESIVIPDTVIGLGLVIEELGPVYHMSTGVFYRCSSLISVNIGDGVSKIEPDTFTGCTSLETLTLGSGVTECSFRGASSTNLSTIICKAVNAPVQDYLQFLKSGGTLYYPAGSDYSSWLNVLNNWTGQEITG